MKRTWRTRKGTVQGKEKNGAGNKKKARENETESENVKEVKKQR